MVLKENMFLGKITSNSSMQTRPSKIMGTYSQRIYCPDILCKKHVIYVYLGLNEPVLFHLKHINTYLYDGMLLLDSYSFTLRSS